MNGDGGSTQNGGVDGQDITPNSVTANEIKSTDILFTTARQADSLTSPINYVLPIVKPPEDGSTYAICNSLDSGGLFTTPSSNSTFQINLTTASNAVQLNFTFQASTTFPIDLILTVINERIAGWYESVFSPIRVVLSLNVGSFPYRTNISVSSPAGTAIVLNAGGTTNQVATFLGWPATSPPYTGNNSFTSPNTNTVTQIVEIDNLLVWKKIPTAFNDRTTLI